MSSSICCADNLNPIGIPPVNSLTLFENFKKSSTVVRSLKVEGEIASSPSGICLTSDIFPLTLFPGKCPPVPVFAA